MVDTVRTENAVAAATAPASASGGSSALNPYIATSGMSPVGPLAYSAARAASAGAPAWAKWFVPLVKAPGTTIEVSIPQRASSPA